MLTKGVLILMKMRKIIYVVLMMVVVGCTPPGPLSEEEGTPPPRSGTPFDYVESSISEGERTDKTNRTMRAIRIFILVVVMAVLLAGCRSGCEQDKNLPPEETSLDCFVPRNDGGTDSLEEYYERMERWEMLHGGMSRWESDK